MEFLFELDAPSGPSHDAHAALDGTDMRATSFGAPLSNLESETPSDSPAAAPADDAPEPSLPASEAAWPRISLRPQPTARTAEEQLEIRKRRIVTRIATCRDAFRALGFLELPDVARKEVARMMMDLDQALDPARNKASVAKDPATALAGASRDELDRLERGLSPLEDRLLFYEDTITDDVFAARVQTGKITAKLLARYGRLLASRRMQAGPRRDRFEWIATALLTRAVEGDRRALVTPERATQVLELLIGGLPHKLNPQELEEAVDYLTDAINRLRDFTDQDAFFDSELFLDVHGYKVSMRELLLHPDFVYLSVAFNAELHNKVQDWIAGMERLHNANQLTQEGSPRDQVTRRLRAQEEAVAGIFGAKARSAPQAAVRVDAARRKEPEVKKAKAPRAKRKQRVRIEFDQRLVLLALAFVVVIGSGGYLAVRIGAIELSPRVDVPAPELKKLSPLFVRSVTTGSGSSASFEGIIQRPPWRGMDPRSRRAEADRIAAGLSAMGIKKAVVKAIKTPVIRIEDGLVVYVLDVGDP